MTGPVATKHAELVAACNAVEGLRAYDDPGAAFDPPCVLVSPPRLLWGTYSDGDPATARHVAFLMVRHDDRAVAELERLVPLVGAAVYGVDDAVITGAMPGMWRTGKVELPCYEIQIEVSL